MVRARSRMKQAEMALHSSGRSSGDSLVLEKPAAGVLQKMPTATELMASLPALVMAISPESPLDVGNQVVNILEFGREAQRVGRGRTSGSPWGNCGKADPIYLRVGGARRGHVGVAPIKCAKAHANPPWQIATTLR